MKMPNQHRAALFIVLSAFPMICRGFVTAPPHRTRHTSMSRSQWRIAAEKDENETTGDPLRAATGIRPSLHPTTINAIDKALKARAAGDESLVVSQDVQPLNVALAAGKIAATAIEQRQLTSQKDGMTLTPEEGQTIAGRVVGVVMRLEELERQLWEKVSKVGWIKKYGEWNTFGVLKDEPNAEKNDLDDRIKDDPLFSMSRAECLLAIFLHTVEIPQMEKIGQTLPGGSAIDFIDEDRRDVLLN